ncbi:MAG: glycosyl transferase family 2, partial [Chloroflexia bacterium]|nr:glycosyl transferase family 2 [Chloroflexia bacterium]
HTIYLELQKNIGRSAIRNSFLKYAKFENLLFLDCDTRIQNNNFISNYLIDNADVICGGRIYSQKPNERKYLLRWKYGINRECKLADQRILEPYHSFMTNNFIVKHAVFRRTQFDERLKGYGHEDSLFGYHLMKNNFLIKHIDNQTIHDFSENSDEFLEKTQQGIENLLFIHQRLIPNGEFAEINKLLATFEKIKRIRSLLSFLSYLLLPFLRYFLE